MLYDILPPLFLLASFGGIAIIISRVVMRVQREELSQHIRAHADAKSAQSAEDVLRSRKGAKVSVVKNRLALVPQAIKSARQQMSERAQLRREKKEEKRHMKEIAQTQAQEQQEEIITTEGQQVVQPQGGRMQKIRERMQNVVARSKDATQQIRQARAEKAALKQQMQEQEEIVTQEEPQAEKKKTIIRRVEKESTMPEATGADKDITQAQEQASATRGGVRNILRRNAAPASTPLQQAAACLKDLQYDKAEDILLPYIVRHTRDVKAYMLLGRAALGRSDWAEAVEIFQQVRAIDDSVAGLHACLGIAAAHAGKMTLAVEMLQRARDIEPENITIREELLNIARRTDNNVLERSVTEELRELRQEKIPAKS